MTTPNDPRPYAHCASPIVRYRASLAFGFLACLICADADAVRASQGGARADGRIEVADRSPEHDSQILKDYQDALNGQAQILAAQADREYKHLDDFLNRVIWGLGILGGAAVGVFAWFLGSTRREIQKSIRQHLDAQVQQAIEQKTSSLHQELRSTQAQLTQEHDRFKDALQLLERVNEVIQEGERILIEGEGATSPALRLQQYELAERTFRKAVQLDERHAVAYVGLGKALKRIGKEMTSDHERRRVLQLAIDATSQAISFNPTYDRAFYNRACYKALIGRPAPEVVADLKQAIGLFELNAVFAGLDPDFVGVRSDPAFAALMSNHRERPDLVKGSGQESSTATRSDLQAE